MVCGFDSLAAHLEINDSDFYKLIVDYVTSVLKGRFIPLVYVENE